MEIAELKRESAEMLPDRTALAFGDWSYRHCHYRHFRHGSAA